MLDRLSHWQTSAIMLCMFPLCSLKIEMLLEHAIKLPFTRHWSTATPINGDYSTSFASYSLLWASHMYHITHFQKYLQSGYISSITHLPGSIIYLLCDNLTTCALNPFVGIKVFVPAKCSVMPPNLCCLQGFPATVCMLVLWFYCKHIISDHLCYHYTCKL